MTTPRAELEQRDRADYGTRLIEQLARDLGMARRLLYEIVQFYRAYPIVHTLRAELSWSQYGVLMRIDDPAFRLVDLKIGVFEDRDVGQMNKYVTYSRERVPQYPWEKPAIGLIVCARAGREEVHYALGGLEEKVVVAEYRVQLPSEQRIKERLEAFSEETDDG